MSADEVSFKNHVDSYDLTLKQKYSYAILRLFWKLVTLTEN